MALAAIDGLTAVALARAAMRTPSVLIGVLILAGVLGFGLMDRLRTVGLTGSETFALACLMAMGVGSAATVGARRELEGPFGFSLMSPIQQFGLALRRAVFGLVPVLVVLAGLVAIARPDLWAEVTPLALAGASVGTAGGVVLGWASGQIPLGRLTEAWSGRGVSLAWLGRGIGPIVLIGLAIQAQGYGATTQAQMLAVGAAVAAVLATLPVDPARLNLVATVHQSMARLVMPLALPPMIAGVPAGVGAGLVAGLAPILALMAGLGLGLVGGLARVFLGLAALGRSEKAARTAGIIELMLAMVLPIAGPLAIGSAALIWIGGRLVWLWRRGERVRWLDPESER